MAGEIALENAGRFAGGLAFGDAAGDVGAGRRVVLAAVQDDGSARLSWRSPPRLSRWRIVQPLDAGKGATAGESGEGGFGADAITV